VLIAVALLLTWALVVLVIWGLCASAAEGDRRLRMRDLDLR
jgi:hypothetical protein